MPVPPASDHLPARFTIGTAIFMACCLLSSARLAIDAPKPGSTPSDVAKRSDQRFATLKAALPERGVVGYIGESGTLGLPDYYLAQYALAPLVLDHSANHALVVGNFSTVSSQGSLSRDLHLVKDFGDGVLLFATQPFTDKDRK
jgi:hypothetical protein